MVGTTGFEPATSRTPITRDAQAELIHFRIEMQPRAKSTVFTSVAICFQSITVVFYFFLPQFCHNELGQGPF